MAKPTIKLNDNTHRGNEVVTLKFDYDPALIGLV